MTSRRPFSIAFIVTGDGGTGTYFRYHNFARGLVALGHRVVVYGQTDQQRWSTRRETRDGVEYSLAPSAPGNRWIDSHLNPGNLFWRFIHKIERADIYHLFQPHENSALPWLALQKLRAKEGALFAWDWDDLWCGGLLTPDTAAHMPKWRYRLIDRFEHTLPRRAELVTTCSAYLARLARDRGATDTAVIHNGYWAANAPADRAALRAGFGLKLDAFYLGFIGWTPTEITWCLEVLAQLPANVRLASCGHDIRRNLKGYPELADRIDYLGKVSADEARRLMNAIDVGLLPLADSPFNQSRLPIKFADYLAAGVPAVCGDVGEVGALGRRIRGAILCPPTKEGWVGGCVAAVREIQQDPARYLPDAVALESHLSWFHLARQLENAYFSAMDRTTHATPSQAELRGEIGTPVAQESR